MKSPSTITKPVIRPRKPEELMRMTAMLKRFEDHLVQQIMELDEGIERSAKEKRLGIARGVRAGLEWAVGIEGKDVGRDVIGAEWDAFRRDEE